MKNIALFDVYRKAAKYCLVILMKYSLFMVTKKGTMGPWALWLEYHPSESVLNDCIAKANGAGYGSLSFPLR